MCLSWLRIWSWVLVCGQGCNHRLPPQERAAACCYAQTWHLLAASAAGKRASHLSIRLLLARKTVRRHRPTPETKAEPQDIPGLKSVELGSVEIRPRRPRPDALRTSGSAIRLHRVDWRLLRPLRFLHQAACRRQGLRRRKTIAQAAVGASELLNSTSELATCAHTHPPTRPSTQTSLCVYRVAHPGS